MQKMMQKNSYSDSTNSPKPNRKTIVLKFGTSVLTQGSQQLSRPHILNIVRQCAQLQQEEETDC